MNIQAILVSDGFGIMLLIMVLISGESAFRFTDFAGKLFFCLLWGTIVLCMFEAASFCIDGHVFPGARFLNYLLNTFLYSINVIFVFLWTLYVDFKSFGDISRIRTRWKKLAVPCFCLLIMIVANCFTPVFFTVSQNNVYARTGLAIIPMLVSFGYLLYTEVMIYSCKHNVKRYLFLPSIIFLLPIFAGGILQFMFYGLSLIWPALSISLTSIYLNIQNEFSSVDSLSGVYTRQYLDRYIKRHISTRYLVGLMIDLDRFKNINDTLGHQSGDEAIRDFGHILRNTAENTDCIARYGGDEFIILRPSQNIAGMDSMVHQLETNIHAFNASGMRVYALSFSYGISIYDSEKDTINDFLKRMDESMYENKRNHTRLFPERRRQ